MALITLPFIYTPGQILPAASLNADFQTIYNDYNGNIDNANIATGANILLGKLGLNPGSEAFNQQLTHNVCWASGLITDVQPRALMTSDGWFQGGAGASTVPDIYMWRSALNTFQMATPTAAAPTLDMNGGSIINVSISPISVSGPFIFNTGRLSLISGSPYADTSSSGSSTIYYQPTDDGNLITIEDTMTSLLVTQTFTAASLAIGAFAAGIYNVYVSPSGATVTITTAAWSGNTPPAVSTDISGRLTASGNAGALLVGAISVNGSGVVVDFVGARACSNLFNAIQKPLLAQDTTASWVDSSTTFVSANGSTVNGVGQLQVLNVVQKDAVALTNFTNLNTTGAIGISVDTVGTPVAQVSADFSGGSLVSISCSYSTRQVGLHTYFRVESQLTYADTPTFYGGALGFMSGTCVV